MRSKYVYISNIDSIKKWWWPFFAQVLDLAIQNSWLLYRHNKSSDSPQHSLLSFRREIVSLYIQKYGSSSRKRSSAGLIKTKAEKIARFDHVDHYQSKLETQKRCGVCKKNTRKGCLKCRVGLHDHCFHLWHDL